MVSAVFLIWGFVALLLAIYIANDADKRGKNALLWFVATLLIGVPMLLIYIIQITPYSRSNSNNHRNRTDNATKNQDNKRVRGQRKPDIDRPEKTLAEQLQENDPNSGVSTKARRGIRLGNERKVKPDEAVDWIELSGSDFKFKHLGTNHNGSPVVKVTDGTHSAKFLLNDGIRDYSPVYRRKFGEEWVNEAQSFTDGIRDRIEELQNRPSSEQLHENPNS